MLLRSRMGSLGRRVPFAWRRPSDAAVRGGVWAVWGPRLVSLLLAALLVQAGFGAWRAGRLPSQVTSSVRPEPVAAAPLDIDVGLIAGRHLFGAPAAAAAQQAPPTRANLVLGGTWHVADGAGGYALIGETGGRQRPYRPGDPLPGGAELVEIRADRVLIRRDGRRETLLLPRGPATAKASPAPANPLQRRYR